MSVIAKSSVAAYLAANLGFLTTAASSIYLISLDGALRVLGVAGLFIGIYINWHFKNKADKRADELHRKAMEPEKD